MRFNSVLLGLLIFMYTNYTWSNYLKESAICSFTLERPSENFIISNSPQQLGLVNKIGRDLLNSATRYLNANGYPGFTEDIEWEFHLINDELAFSMDNPIGQIRVSTGMMEVAQNANGLAAIMSHMIAHSLVKYGKHRMKAAQLQEEGGENNSQSVENINSNNESSEFDADRIGLTLMAIAGYDPAEALKFWKRISNTDVEISPEFIDIHQINESRVINLQNWAPKARAEAQKYGVTSFK